MLFIPFNADLAKLKELKEKIREKETSSTSNKNTHMPLFLDLDKHMRTKKVFRPRQGITYLTKNVAFTLALTLTTHPEIEVWVEPTAESAAASIIFFAIQKRGVLLQLLALQLTSTVRTPSIVAPRPFAITPALV